MLELVWFCRAILTVAMALGPKMLMRNRFGRKEDAAGMEVDKNRLFTGQRTDNIYTMYKHQGKM